jgi:hypothetical protein
MKRILATAIMVIALLAIPSVAFADSSSTCSSYNPQLCQVVSNTNNTNTPGSNGTVAASTSSLPFTGLDIGFLAAGGVVLVGAGLFVRRLSAQR